VTRRSCPLCNGTGYVVEDRDGAPVARPCKCRTPDRATRLVRQAGIPERYRERCVFEMFKAAPGSSLENALVLARKYAEDYPAFPDGPNGLLFIGPCGVGKTHLAVSVLQEILMRRGLPALFVDLNDLYREIRASYDRKEAGETEYDIMAPLVEAPLLLVDELGCVNTQWAQDTLHYLVSQRYNEQLPTLCTTNYLDESRGGEASLEDRIGTRTRSRLHEMCRTVLMDAPDFRKRTG
jgi:DNA replication protein DnaC